jgi:micrococcal nuclease
MLAYLISERGENLNLEMVRQGWSPFYRKFGEGRFAQKFAKAEADARRRAKGMWAR